jgi:Na+/H+ antiporter NhaD/arsenite permease-like protein
MLAGENMITDAIIDAILILLIFVCNATSKLSLISNVHQIRIADNKIINDKFSTLGFLSAIFHPV